MGEYAEWYVDGIALLAQHPQPAVPTVAELTGRPGTTFAAWAAANAGALPAVTRFGRHQGSGRVRHRYGEPCQWGMG